jgi:dephospho-CoA kinase
MQTVVVTGGIGSGKSTVVRELARLGAVVIDADVLAREALATRSPAAAAVLAHFGAPVRAVDGSIDRAALGAAIFERPEERRWLEALVHPIVRAGIDAALDRIAALDAREGTDHVVAVEIPLFVESGGRARYPRTDAVVVVDASLERAVERLVAMRGMSAAEARARIAAQADRAARLETADRVIVNDGTPAELLEAVQDCWRWLVRQASQAGGGGPTTGGSLDTR